MFSRLIYRNAKRSRKENLIYFATLVTAIASFYIILSLGRQDVILFLKEFESDSIDKLLAQMPIVYLFALFLLFFLILFANQYQLNRRSKEFGLYLLLGMRKKRLVLQLLAEGLITSILALIGGILIGGFLAEIISLTVSKLVGQGIINHQISLSVGAIFFTIIGFLFIQFIALVILGGRLFNKEVHQLLYGQMDKKQDIGHFKGNVLNILVGSVLLGVAYWIVLYRFMDFAGLLLFVALVLGSLGTILFMRGFGKLLGLLASLFKYKSTKGLHTFTLRQFQENVANRSISVAVTSILITLSIILIADGASTFIGLESVFTRNSSVYDFTVNGDSQKIEQFLTSEKMKPYVEDLNQLEFGNMKYKDERGEDGFPLSLVDWSKLREQIIKALPNNYKEQVLSGEMQSYSFSSENPEALNLFGVLETASTTPYLIPESSYNGLLKTIGKKPLNLHSNEIALYFNPDFMPMDNLESMPVLDNILEKAAKEGQSLMSINDQAIYIHPSIPMRGLVADRSVKIFSAFIVPDHMFEQLLNTETYVSYWNFRIPQKLQDQQGLMKPMMEARDLLKSSGFKFESYLQNFGRKLFYVVAGSYATLYMGFLFLIIACTVLALQFLTQMKQTGGRYVTLSMLGAKRNQMKKSMHRQVLLTFLLPISLACVSGAVGIRAMISFVTIHIEDKTLLYPIAFTFTCIVIVILVIYGVAVARSADYEIDKLRWKPNID
ncbi:ABC transporter permease [Aneurinibacillus aneurinilyticus]|jgi:putative ABC transport system permease protein|uniref:Efflux ABC transporter, permease protein n=1 Tax=Aneurinibacillus aneurinilyticus ATCC 12856 TaxID=649747 RepID=U1WR75_ANEAE|nr:ABC transporter permease [Aneurinibacillus aneurinilyticus]ERI11124.1 efflux ABC transporter, permease protein [Aneurinibacillus aneurinilyticus ATCC 12856]MED0707176.1 ABC transporter permease [Aneurinibacillus aneurinilyticus]MED0726316.1 ABC transporter permease [Aneurinibacillus aneurinilyticus]MED0735306.1 ABC transporter permease [Aneurinibacillus aneurinilyticus]MED0743562.1 ABC transporter permease [Aneurinibacillus aneurinilyticus]